MKPEPVEIGAEPRLLTSHPEIADQGKAEPAADCGAMDRGDNRLSGAEQPDRLFVQVTPGSTAAALADGAGIHAFREIGAGAKRASLGGKNDGATLGIGIEPLKRVADFANQRAVKEIVRRPPHLDRRDKPVAGDANLAIGGVFGHLLASSLRIGHNFDFSRLLPVTLFYQE